jgi:hypothetical protein
MRWIFVVLAAALCLDNSRADDEDIIFAAKLFVDLPRYGSVAISGTLTGDGIAYKNNAISISCFKDRQECYIAYIQQIGHNQMGRLQFVDIYPIAKWDDKEVVAVQEVGELDCARITIAITRKSQSALYVREPINQTRPQCSQFPDEKVYRWTIEDSPGHKRLFAK